MKKIILSMSVVVFCMGSMNVQADEIAGVFFEKQIQEDQVRMQLQGTGIKSVAFFKAFAAGLYVSDQQSLGALGRFPKRIEVAYFVSIPADKMNDFTIKSMKKNISKQEFQQIGNELDTMSRYFVDLEPGDRYSLTFIPGVGTKFVHNNRLVGTIKGKTFAKALFSTWLGEKPFDKKLKKQILGKYKVSDSENVELAKQIKG